jgi:hypothetical protein
MKNILAENLLRFGVKNLSESQKRKLQEQTEGGGAGAQLTNLGLPIPQETLAKADTEGLLGLGEYSTAFKQYAGDGGSGLIGKNLYLLKSFEVIPQTKDQAAGVAVQRLAPSTGVRSNNILPLPIKSIWTSRVAGSSYQGAVRAYFTTYQTSFNKTQLETNLAAWKQGNPSLQKISGVDLTNLITNPTNVNGVDVNKVKPVNTRGGITLRVNQKLDYDANIDMIMQYLTPTNLQGAYFTNIYDTIAKHYSAGQSKQRGDSTFLTVYTGVVKEGGVTETQMVGYMPQIWDVATQTAGEFNGVTFT